MSDGILNHQVIRRVAVLTNPAAGRGAAAETAITARRELFKRGIDVVALAGASPQASRELAKQALDDEHTDALIVCGGDGLIQLALQEQAGSDTPLGVIPVGTGNDYAREYRIPFDVKEAVEVIANGYSTRTDLGVIKHGEEERYFGTIALAGFDSLVTQRANSLRWPHGKAKYLAASALEFGKFRARPAKLTTPDGTVLFDDAAVLCVVGNTKTYGGGMKVCPEADHHDGLFDITVLGDISRRKFLTQAANFMAGRFDDLKGAISQFRVPMVRLEMPGVISFVDGDLAYETPVDLRIAPGAGHYLVPKP